MEQDVFDTYELIIQTILVDLDRQLKDIDKLIQELNDEEHLKSP